MPLYDRICDCGWQKEDCYEPREFALACPQCGAQTRRWWTRMSVIPDTFTHPVYDENLAATPYIHYSRSERKRRMALHGVTERVRHLEHDHRDKSPHTVRWV